MIVNTHVHRRILVSSRRVNDLELQRSTEKEDNHKFRDFFLNSFKCSIFALLPFAEWIKQYPWRYYLLKDFISGLTVSVLQVPQGLAYAQLADCPPVIGLYMAVFPTLVYALLTHSKHVSYGPMALVCLMCDAIITSANGDKTKDGISREDVGATIAFVVGLCFIGMYILRLGKICFLMSKTFISSFISGVSVHVFTSQVKELLGIKVESYHGPLSIVWIYIEILGRIMETNLMALGMGVVTIVVLEVYDTYGKQKLANRRIILPLEFFVVVTFGVITYLANLEEQFHVRVVGSVPKGLPWPKVPEMYLIQFIFVQSLIVAIVSYFITESVAFYYASIRKYKMDPQQDFLAQGLGNLLGSFFSCMPVAGSVSRSAVQERLGGETQMASIIAVAIMVMVLFFLADFLKPVPKCVLAGIIINSVVNIFKKSVKDIELLWFLSKHELFLWSITFLVVVLGEIDLGLVCGLLISLLINALHNADPEVCLLGRVSVAGGNYIYVQLTQEIGSEVPGIKIIRINGAINFVTQCHLRSRVFALSGVDPEEEAMRRKERREAGGGDEGEGEVDEEEGEQGSVVPFKQGNPDEGDRSEVTTTTRRLRFIVLDATHSTYVDYTGLLFLEALCGAYDAVGVGLAVVARDARISPFRQLHPVVHRLETASTVPQPSGWRRDPSDGADQASI